jgi:AcrR family transcriptional regulator
MTVNSKRRYNSTKRQDQADATQRRILRVAEELFASQGYATVTMEAIAGEAKVAPATLYLHFSGKSAVIAAMAENLAAAPDLSVDHVLRELNPVEQLRIGAHILRTLNERSWVVADILRGLRGSDEELARLWALWQERHLTSVRRAVEAVAARDSLRRGLTLDEATDLLYAIAGTEVYRALIQERGWSPERYEHWLFQFGCRELLK